MATKIKALQAWCRKMTEGYRDVDVKDFTVSWRDGLAFCAMIHRFRPDLIDFDSLSKENVFDNNNLAFTMAEKELNIPAFLEAADMVTLKTPDKLSIITYVSQYYNYLHALPQLGGPGVKGKVSAAASAGIKRHQTPEPLTEPETKKITHNRDTTSGEVTKAKSSSVGDKCSICGNKVYLLERHVEGGQLYHRSCYRHSDLSPTGKVFSRSPFLSPSLHEVKSPLVHAASKEVPPKSNELSRTFTLQDTSTSENQGAANKTESKKSQLQKHLFSDGHQGGNQETEKNKSANSIGLKGALHGVHARSTPNKGDLHSISSEDSHVNDALHGDAKLAVSQANEARTIEKYINNMTSKEEVSEVKPSKRQLPLIFQTPVDASSETAHSRPTTSMEGSKNISETKCGDLKSDTKPTLAPTATRAIGKASPVAKPRYKKRLDSRKEEKMDFDEPVKQNLSSSSTPKPSPRLSSSVGKTNLTEKSLPPVKPFSPDSSMPPPLPASAPPSVPSSHLSNQIVSSRQETISQQRPNHVDTPVKSNLQSEKQTPGGVFLSRASTAATPTTPQTVTSSQPHTATTSLHSSVSSITVTTSSSSSSKSKISREEPMEVETITNTPAKISTEKSVGPITVTVDTDKKNQNVLFDLKKSLANVRNTFNTTTSTSTSGVHKNPDQSKSASGSNTQSLFEHNPKISLLTEKNSKTFVGSEALSNKAEGSDPKTTFNKPHEKIMDKKTIAIKGADTSDKKHTVTETSKMPKIVINSESKPLLDKGTSQSKGKSLVSSTSNKQKIAEVESISTQKTKDTVGRKNRPKSAADVLDPHGSSKMLTIKTESATPPSFMQVKLRGTNMLNGKELSKSANNLLVEADSSSSKPSWQLEAERRMAAVRDGGFVDPETKKSAGGGDDTEPGHENSHGARKDSSMVVSTQKQTHSDQRGTTQETKISVSVAGAKREEKTKDVVKTVPDSPSKPGSKEKQNKNENKKQETNIIIKAIPDKSRLPPPKPERTWATLDAKEKEEKKSEMNSLEPTRQLLAQEPNTEVVILRKKIPFNDVKTADDPAHLQTPTHGPRKKVSVDVKFDFGVSLKSPTKEQHTPPQRPPPPKITPTHLSAIELHQQLLEIDSKLSELELKGRDLEDSIRSVTTAEDEDEMLMEWFKLVTKKNELVRKEADLVYQSREQTLEDEQVQIDSQLHYILGKEDAEKSFEEKEEEEYLIQRKLQIVNQRNCIVDSIDEDRLRYEEEDRNVAQLMESKGFSKTTVGTVMNDKGKKVFTSTFYT